ncbi:MAG TPA: hypothetical protein VM639_00840 [Dongiaceae bacterium]|nr:hypothetical protein [Dongiaceae bacterium]
MSDIEFLKRIHTNSPKDQGEASFFKFYRENLKIVERFLELAELMRQFQRHYRASAIVDRIRWDHDIRGADGKFKIANSRKAYLARLAQALEVVPEGFFTTKELTRSKREKFTLKAFKRMRHDTERDD